jgi:long-chain fatty acid transport protein
MNRGKLSLWGTLGACALGLLAAQPGHAAGFSIFEQGSKAMGMGGAFTAQADDPSALFHNAGGLAFVTERQTQVGATYIRGLKAEFEGANPFPGEGYKAEQEDLSEIPPHLYYVQPINDTWKFGLGIETPFGLTTEWKDPEEFAGRFISTKAALRAIDVNPTIGWQITPTFGIGVGAIARFSDVDLNRDIGANNPFTQTRVNVAKLNLQGGFDQGYGWNIGLLHKFNNSFSWGLSYRSKVEVEFEGDARLTQLLTGNTQFDAVVRGSQPFDRDLPVQATIEFPDEASFGLAFALSQNLLLETDVNWTGWSSFDEPPINFVNNDLPDTKIIGRWEDVYNYRAGLKWTTSATSEWRFGYVYDQSPQPEEAVNPQLPDADRNGFSIGYGHKGAITTDVALMYLDFKERSRDKSFVDETRNDFFGTYNTRALLLGITFGF